MPYNEGSYGEQIPWPFLEIEGFHKKYGIRNPKAEKPKPTLYTQKTKKNRGIGIQIPELRTSFWEKLGKFFEVWGGLSASTAKCQMMEAFLIHLNRK